MTDGNYTFRSLDRETGVWHEVEITAEQAFDMAAAWRDGKLAPLAYFPRDQQILVDDDGAITERESAIPQRQDTEA